MANKPKKLREKDVLKWLANGETGLSSKAMAFCALGVAVKSSYDRRRHPLDPSDFNRCLLLVEQVPAIKQHFQRIAKLSKEWGRIIKQWDLIRESFISEVGWNWSKAKSAPKTYELMRRIESGSSEDAGV